MLLEGWPCFLFLLQDTTLPQEHGPFMHYSVITACLSYACVEFPLGVSRVSKTDKVAVFLELGLVGRLVGGGERGSQALNK